MFFIIVFLGLDITYLFIYYNELNLETISKLQ